jgi:hypothetical protein
MIWMALQFPKLSDLLLTCASFLVVFESLDRRSHPFYYLLIIARVSRRMVF